MPDNPAQSAGAIDFNIPAQSLANALVAYGAATGLEVYYDGTLALGRRSAALKGKFMPVTGLTLLLRGTGYVPRATGSDTFTLAVEPGPAPLSARVSNAVIRQYEPYLAALQARIVDALCRTAIAPVNETIFSFSVDASGVISRVDILDSSDDAARNAAISVGLRGLSIGKRPPVGLPQPVTMSVYPPSAGEGTGCASSGSSQTEH